MPPTPRQHGLTLVEVLLGLAITALLMASLVTMLKNASDASIASAEQLDLQTQAQFAVQRIAMQIQATPNVLLLQKSDDASSFPWLLPATYALQSGSVADTLALTETVVGAAPRVLAEPVSIFSITSAPVTTGQTTLILVSVTLERTNPANFVKTTAAASLSVRMGGPR